MSESSSGVVGWTAIAALVLSLSTVGYAVYRAAKGPMVRAFPAEDILLFGYPAAEGQPKEVGAAAVFELANTSPDYPDIITSQSIRMFKDGKPVGCLSARGQVKLIQPDPNAPADPAAIHAPDAAEYVDLTGMSLSVLDVSSRAELTAGMLLSRRQLFDQLASRSVVDDCHEITADQHYTVQQMVDDFKGQTIDLRYEAVFAESAALAVTCGVNLTDRRAELMMTRGWINAACDKAEVKALPGQDGGLVRFLNRVF